MRAASATLALATLASAGPAEAARIPDWAREVVGTAPSVPEGVPAHERRVLFQEKRIGVEPDGRLRLRWRLAEQYLRVPEESRATRVFRITDASHVVTARGWHVPWEGRAQRSWGPAVEMGTREEVTDARVRVVPLAGVAKGSMVFFEFEVLDRRWGLDYLEVFHGGGVPIDRARFEVATPPGWSVRHAWLAGTDAAPHVEGDVTSWELGGIVPAETQDMDLAEASIDLAPALVVSFAPPAGTPVETAFFDRWNDLALWYETMAAGRASVTPAVEAVGGTAAAGTSEGSFDRLLALSRFTRDGVRYVAKEVGIGAFQPRPAADVLANRFGDCKDKATLLQSLLAADSVAAFPIMVHATRSRTVAQSVPSVASFNHVVVGIAIADGMAVPDWARPAIVGAGALGPLLVVDPTEEGTAPGWLPAYLGGKTALVVAGEQSTLVRLPDALPEAHRIEHSLEAEVADGTVTLVRVAALRGWPASRARAIHRSSSTTWRAERERQLRTDWPTAEVLAFEVAAEEPDGAFVETVRLRVPVPAGDPPLLWAFPGAMDELERVNLGMRQSPVVYPHALELRTEVRWTGPFARTAPEELTASGEGWSVSSTLDGEGETRSGSWSARLGRTRFETADFAELKRFWAAADRAASFAITLEH